MSTGECRLGHTVSKLDSECWGSAGSPRCLCVYARAQWREMAPTSRELLLFINTNCIFPSSVLQGILGCFLLLMVIFHWSFLIMKP